MLDVAIFGLGNWGQRLVGAVQGKSERIRFIRGVARSPEKVSGFAREQGFDVHTRYDSVLEDNAVKAIVVATPHSLHHEHVIRAARAGKPVLVEKPFALTRADAEAAVAACETARGEVLAGEGVIGLTRAFLTAGSASVVCTLWPVDDSSAAATMVRFCEHYQAGETKDVALREAVREVRTGRSRDGTPLELPGPLKWHEAWAHPYHWAPFVLVGEWERQAAREEG